MKKLFILLAVVTSLSPCFGADLSCFGLSGDHFYLCQAIKKDSCSYASQGSYLLCKGILNNQCGLVSQNIEDYTLCRGVVTGRCYSTNYLDRILCEKFK